MNNQDFERLKALCEKEGFEISIDHPQCDTFNISVKDIWDGVEFAECVQSTSPCFISGKIYLVDLNKIQVDYSKYFKPSTKQAYVEQLKKEAHRLFGEIKVGDRFDRLEIDEKWGVKEIKRLRDKSFDWKYFKSTDTLYKGNLAIYQQGKWAKRAPEKVKVEFLDDSLDVYNGIEEWGFTFGVHNHEYGNKLSLKVGQFLAKQLEKYLNDENC